MPQNRSARIGVHGRNDPDFTEGDYLAVRQARLETIKMLSLTKTGAFERLRRENPDLEFIVRLHDSRISTSHPTPEEFANRAVPRINELRPFAVKFEIHNEPNHDGRFEGWGSPDDDARSFRDWYRDVLRRLKAACPWASFGFPGLAPHYPHRDLEWLGICKEAIEASDWLGCHTYWQGDNSLKDEWGLRFKTYHDRFPNKVIEITEFGNTTPGWTPDNMAAEYVKYYQELFKYPYLGSASAFILSSVDAQWWPFVWRKESGEFLPVVRAVGDIPRPPVVPPKPGETKPPYRVEWLEYKPAASLVAGERTTMGLKFRNAGDKTWLAANVGVGYRWYTPQGQPVQGAEDLRTPLPANVTPGMSVILSEVQLSAPRQSGPLVVRWDLIEDGATWFASKGSPPLNLNVTVGPSSATDEQYFPETKCVVKGAFLEFFRKYGLDFCGYPITNAFAEAGLASQYFQRLALEEYLPGQVRLKPVGSEAYTGRARIAELVSRVNTLIEEVALLQARLSAVLPGGLGPKPTMQDVTDSLPHHATLKYQTRPLRDIQNLVVHHTAGPADVGPEAIARYHIQQRGWPGIGYHFVIMGDGAIYQTNRLETISYQAQTANPTSLGIAFAGNLMGVGPTNDQLASGGHLLAYLMQALGLTSSSIKGHKNFVVTACPGDQWDSGINWRNKLLEQAAAAHPR